MLAPQSQNGIDTAIDNTASQLQQPRKLDSRPLDEKFPQLAQFEADPWLATCQHYAACAQARPDVIKFIDKQLGIDPANMAGMMLGFSDRSLGKTLPTCDSKRGGQLRHKLVELGLFKADTGHETLRGYVTCALFDSDGRITGIEGHKLDPKSKNAETIVIGSGMRADQLACAAQHQSEAASHDHQVKAVSDSTAVTKTAADDSSSITPQACTESCTHVSADSVTISRGDRTYKVKGLERNRSPLTLKLFIQASRAGLVHLDCLDLVKSAARTAFIKATALELLVDEQVIRKDIGFILMQLEDLRQQQLDASQSNQQKTVTLSESEIAAALELLRDPGLIGRIVSDLEQCGMVGESFNKLAVYLAVVSRKLSTPLAILIQSSSSSGKTTLMDSVLALLPAEDYLRLSNLTSQSLYYLDSALIQHKTLAISEDHGLAEAAYALKLLQSEGQLTHATVAKDAGTGRVGTQIHTVQGPVQLLLTSTGQQIDEELQNRCLVLTVDESTEQTQAIQARQRKMRSAEAAKTQAVCSGIRSLHQNAQRLIQPLRVYNNLALSADFPCERTRNRRDYQKYLTLIEAIALLHQHQRPITTDADGVQSIDVLPSDIELADKLMQRLLTQSLDELTPQTKRCLELLKDFVDQQANEKAVQRSDYRFTRRALREAIGWTDHQVRDHLAKLVSLEFVITHRGKQGSTYVYQLG